MDANALINGDLKNITNCIGAAGALGTAAFGLVDSSKVLWGGISNFGFGSIKKAVKGLTPGLGADAFNHEKILRTLRANWLNGMAKADQKAAAKALIRLCMVPQNVKDLCAATGVAEGPLSDAINHVHAAAQLTPADFNSLGQVDAVVSAVLDEGYERADQQYRNGCKALALVFAVVLALIAGRLIYYNAPVRPTDPYLWSSTFFLAAVVGVVSTPLAPIAKDLASALNSAVTAVSAAKRK